MSLDIVELLASSHVPLSLGDIAAQLELSKAAVHGVLSNLEARRYVERTPERAAYRLGRRLWELGLVAGETIELPKIAHRYLERLVALSGESAQLAEYVTPGEVVYLDRIDSPNPVRANIYVGRRAPAYCVATGRALLAFQSPGEIERVCSGPLERFTKKTIINKAKLRRELDFVRQRGFAINHGEYRGEIVGVAAPIRDHQGRVIAAISVSGPEYRFTVARATELAPAVMDASDAVAREFGQHFIQKRRA
jgi:IclR family transcriptional regulator, KDG regulon repressor